MEMNYFKKTGKMMVAACMLAGLPFIPGTVSASELQTQMMSVQMESTTFTGHRTKRIKRYIE